MRPPCRAHHASVQPLRVLDCLESDTTGRGLHYHRVTRIPPSALDSHVDRAPCDGQRARLLEGECCRLVSNKERSCNGHTCQRSVGKAKDCKRTQQGIAHDARSVAARWSWVARILAEHVEHIAKVEANGTHAQQHLGATEWRERRLWLKEEVADRASRVQVQSHEAVQGWGRRHEARCGGLALVQHTDLGLGERKPQYKRRRHYGCVHGHEGQ